MDRQLDRTEQEHGKPTQHRVAFANGGSLHHALPVGSSRALCGHEPKSNGRVMRRAKWRVFKDGVTALVTCRKCIAAEARK